MTNTKSDAECDCSLVDIAPQMLRLREYLTNVQICDREQWRDWLQSASDNYHDEILSVKASICNHAVMAETHLAALRELLGKKTEQTLLVK